MAYQRIAGLLLLAGGIVVFIIGVNASDSIADQMSRFFTGHFTEPTLWYLVGGTVLVILGLSLAMFGSRGARA